MRVSQWSVLVIAVGIVACAGGDAADDQAAADSAAAAAAAPAPAPPEQLGDAEVAHVVWTANAGDVAGGQAAKGKATDAEVKAFAVQMVTDHGASNAEVEALTTKLSVTPAENRFSTQMKGDHDRAMTELAAKSGVDFDRAYIAHEVGMHQAILQTIDQQLMPAAQNEELRALLLKTRPVIEGHLQRAQAIQTKLGTGS